jgi:zinc-ribbon domain
MYCPNCGNKNSTDQRFCRSCGLGLEKIAESLTEQLPTKAVQSLQARKERLERLGVAALSVFGLGVFGFILYAVFQKLMLTQGITLAALASLGLIIILGCGLLSVILFAKANEVTEASAQRRIEPPAEARPGEVTGKLLDAHHEPTFGVTEQTTELLTEENLSRINAKPKLK